MNAPAIGHRPKLYSAAQVRDLDRRATETLGVPGYTLMRRAAKACFCLLRARWPAARRIAVLCGPGNNGGDGFEIARLAVEAGLAADVFQVGPQASRGDAVFARAAWERSGGGIATPAPDALAQADVIVDAIFGIGITRPVEGEARNAIDVINRRHAGQGVMAVDVPSGLDSDTGAIQGAAVSADVTVSFIGRKLGLYVGAGPDLAGMREFSDLDLPASLAESSASLADLLTQADLDEALPRRPRTSHKGRHGHVLLVGGDAGTGGAILLAARGALRAGAGLVTVATRGAHAGLLAAAQPEAMFRAVEGGADLAPLLERASVIGIGPGLGQNAWGRSLLALVLASGKPLVIDADALNLVAERSDHRLPADCVITPHPGEAARLLGTSSGSVQAERPASAQRLHERTGAVVVLKGACTLVQGARLALSPYGNPGMGTGGMGDVLTGVIAAMRGQGLDAEAAARTGVLAHALAGDLAAARGGERGLLPEDLVAALREIVNPR